MNPIPQRSRSCGSDSPNIRPFRENCCMVSRIHVVGAGLVTMLVLLGALVGSGIVLLNVPDRAVAPGSVFTETTNNFDQLVVVLMENKNLNEVRSEERRVGKE